MLERPLDGGIGVVGGLGPLASAEFLKSIYQCVLSNHEQLSPKIIMISDPTFPDRTEALLAGQVDDLLERLTLVLQQLDQLGASRIIICCVTIHYLLPRLPLDLRARVISLLDVIFEQVEQSKKKHLLICSSGTRQLGIFENHSGWQAVKEFFVLPNEGDQEIIHRDLIHAIKTAADVTKQVPLLKSLLRKYQVDSFIVGCTEIHLLAKLPEFAVNGKGPRCIDPLAILARGIYERSI